MPERRNYKRIFSGSAVRCNGVDAGTPYDEITHCINISGGGLCMQTRGPLPEHGPVALEIQVPGYVRAIPARGEVVWTESADRSSYHTGVEFTKIDHYDRSLLLHFIHFGDEYCALQG